MKNFVTLWESGTTFLFSLYIGANFIHTLISLTNVQKRKCNFQIRYLKDKFPNKMYSFQNANTVKFPRI